MKYYSEETVRDMIKKVKVIHVPTSQYDSSLCEERRTYPKFKDFPSIEIPDKHGNIIDANELIEHYEALAADNGVYTEDAEETVETINKIPKVILKGNVEATE